MEQEKTHFISYGIQILPETRPPVSNQSAWFLHFKLQPSGEITSHQLYRYSSEGVARRTIDKSVQDLFQMMSSSNIVKASSLKPTQSEPSPHIFYGSNELSLKRASQVKSLFFQEDSELIQSAHRKSELYLLYSSGETSLKRVSQVRGLLFKEKTTCLEEAQCKPSPHLFYSSNEVCLRRASQIYIFFLQRNPYMRGWRKYVKYDKPPISARVLAYLKKLSSRRNTKSPLDALGAWQFDQCPTLGWRNIPATMRV